MARLARTRNRVEAPRARPRLGVVRVDEAANADLAACHADQNLVLHRKRRERERMARFVVGRLDVPHDVAGLRVQGDEVRVECPEVEAIAH